jgi:hypothetical protein
MMLLHRVHMPSFDGATAWLNSMPLALPPSPPRHTRSDHDLAMTLTGMPIVAKLYVQRATVKD